MITYTLMEQARGSPLPVKQLIMQTRLNLSLARVRLPV